MSILSKSNEIQKLKNHLKEQYGEDGCRFYAYAITDFHFNSNFRNPELTIKVSYFSLEKEITIRFFSFQFYFTSDESNMSYLADSYVDGFAFIAIYKENDMLKSMLKNGYNIEFELREKEVRDFFIFRILTQNYFVDVFTDTLPEIIY
ncbi:hypothetical protein CGC56_05070 [Capnocytophaga canimorsus]|uniref:Uncharacterized protein n=2 Tax=Capnocytophaga canimorsus TaxID=28188 RepID=A0A250G4B0_9FLAO|nr:hypothetical protein [Capnocytophaga canimorsus]ATA91595.1 hypothetical protein CGC56_05070 [Capnocytophaga canimorsus]